MAVPRSIFSRSILQLRRPVRKLHRWVRSVSGQRFPCCRAPAVRVGCYKACHCSPASNREQDIWQGRYRSIVDLEHHLHLNGTRIVKFFLHLSQEEQRKRFIQRIDDPRKNWKFSAADLRERKFWPQYMKAYQACLSATSTVASPWYVVPADDKNNTRLIVSQIVLATLEALNLQYPVASPARVRELKAIREKLTR